MHVTVLPALSISLPMAIGYADLAETCILTFEYWQVRERLEEL